MKFFTKRNYLNSYMFFVLEIIMYFLYLFCVIQIFEDHVRIGS